MNIRRGAKKALDKWYKEKLEKRNKDLNELCREMPVSPQDILYKFVKLGEDKEKMKKLLGLALKCSQTDGRSIKYHLDYLV
jgi:hypothetical protein